MAVTSFGQTAAPSPATAPRLRSSAFADDTHLFSMVLRKDAAPGWGTSGMGDGERKWYCVGVGGVR